MTGLEGTRRESYGLDESKAITSEILVVVVVVLFTPLFCIISQPRVLLLDEATSALDPTAESIVQQALDRVSKGRTTIIIAHKIATIQKADNIIVMTKGRIAEQGTHQSLIVYGGIYARLVQIQNLTGPGGDSGDVTEHSESSEIALGMPPELSRALTRHDASSQTYVVLKRDLGGYDQYKQRGIISAKACLVGQTPELSLVYTVVLLGCILAGGTSPGQAILIANIMNTFSLSGSEKEREGQFYAKMFIVLAYGCLVAYFALGYGTNVAQTLSHKFRRITLQSILRQDLQFFDRPENSTGSLVSQIDSNPEDILELMSYNMGLILVSFIKIAACSTLAIIYSWRLGLVVICSGLPPLVAAGYLKIRLDAKLDHETARLQSDSSSIVSETINSIRTVSSLAIERSVLGRSAHELDCALAGSKRPVFTIMTRLPLRSLSSTVLWPYCTNYPAWAWGNEDEKQALYVSISD